MSLRRMMHRAAAICVTALLLCAGCGVRPYSGTYTPPPEAPSKAAPTQASGPLSIVAPASIERALEEINDEFAEADGTSVALAWPLSQRVEVGPDTLTARFAEIIDWLDTPCMSISAPPLFFLTGEAARQRMRGSATAGVGVVLGDLDRG